MLIKNMSFARANMEAKIAYKNVSRAITEQFKSYWLDRLRQLNNHINEIRSKNNVPIV